MTGPLDPLPYTWLGALALGVLWVNTLLIAAAALQQRARLGSLLGSLLRARAEGRLIEAVVARGDGPDEALAERRIIQHGRAITTGGAVDRILYTQRSASERCFGGSLEGGERIEPSQQVELWLERSPVRVESDFDHAWERASTNKGVTGECVQTVRRGDRVFVHRDGELLRIATIEPVGEVRRLRGLLAGFALLAVAGCAVITAIACWPPLLGPISTLGGALGLVYFLLVQPAGTRARDAARLPHQRLHSAEWARGR